MNTIEIARTTADTETWSIGQIFVNGNNIPFMLVQMGPNDPEEHVVTMVNLSTGERIDSHLLVEDMHKVTRRELWELDEHFELCFEPADAKLTINVCSKPDF